MRKKMKVLKHGKYYELGTITCNKCNCEFTYTLNDTKIEHRKEYNTYDRDEYDVHIVYCPECHNKIDVKI